MNQLENGYSVSETDGEDRSNMLGADGDILSLRSGLSGIGALLQNGPGGLSGNSPAEGIRSDPLAALNGKDGLGGLGATPGFADGDLGMRQQEQQHVLYQEIASQKIKYFKKIANLEKMIEQVKGEKA